MLLQSAEQVTFCSTDGLPNIHTTNYQAIQNDWIRPQTFQSVDSHINVVYNTIDIGNSLVQKVSMKE